jgi:hypothetical protein
MRKMLESKNSRFSRGKYVPQKEARRFDSESNFFGASFVNKPGVWLVRWCYLIPLHGKYVACLVFCLQCFFDRFEFQLHFVAWVSFENKHYFCFLARSSEWETAENLQVVACLPFLITGVFFV